MRINRSTKFVNGGRRRGHRVYLRAAPHALVQVGRDTARVRARPTSDHELDGYWPQLTKMWPAYQDFYDKEGQRSVFVLEPQRD